MPCPIIKITADHQIPELLKKFSERQTKNPEIEIKVAQILKDVQARGDIALLDYSREYDCPNMQTIAKISEQEIALAASTIDPDDLEIIRCAATNIREFHEAQKEKSWFMTREDGSILGQKVTAIERVGLYVPGGQKGNTPLISSILMNAIPAQVAGVEEIVVVSPPREDGTLNPLILAAAWLLDITEIYALGSAWAIGALAYGTQSIRAVDMIAGPGNSFVTTAKSLVQGQVAIDMLAGPSEILIIADDTQNADFIAADMLSQAEHDSLASSILLTDSPLLIEKVKTQLEIRLASLPRKEIAKKSLENHGMIVHVPNLNEAFKISNHIAPEHLEIMTRDPWSLLPQVKNAGAVFLGAYSPEATGDYYAGPNHVLPTNGTARFSSALSVNSFQKKTSIVACSAQFTRQNAQNIARFARMENLEAHALSAEARLK